MSDQNAIVADTSKLVTTAQRPDQNPALVYLAGLNSSSSRRTMRRALDAIADMVIPGTTCEAFPWGSLRFQHTAAIRARLAERYAPATANKMLSALRGVLKTARRLGQMSAEDCANAVDLKTVTGKKLPAGRDLSAGEVAALIAVCENDPTGAGPRDAAVIALMMGVGGLRRSEIVALNLADYDAESGRLVVRGKRQKERAVYVVNGAARALTDWLAVRGAEPGPLFCPVNKAGRVTIRRMSDQAVYKLLKTRAEAAGVADFSPHDMRRTFIGDLLDAGVDIATVAKIVGHDDVRTTAQYDRRPEEAKRQAVARLHIPYRGRLI